MHLPRILIIWRKDSQIQMRMQNGTDRLDQIKWESEWKLVNKEEEKIQFKRQQNLLSRKVGFILQLQMNFL
ncbi:unnamed protein product [Paramecium octaurelia]|uniref:Uncharacterized protein n=1 Tax=Paramecium octaurelia TaxID=43137 RepID=A0A8S1X6Q6_PAROT|nr:unnamed protein product [Paramecium octaurelia]